MFFLAYLTPFLSLVVSAVFLKEAIELCAFVALVFIVGGILLQGAWAAGEGSCRGDFISGVPLHFIPGQAAPDSAFASLLSFRFAPLQQRLRRPSYPSRDKGA